MWSLSAARMVDNNETGRESTVPELNEELANVSRMRNQNMPFSAK